MGIWAISAGTVRIPAEQRGNVGTSGRALSETQGEAAPAFGLVESTAA